MKHFIKKTALIAILIFTLMLTGIAQPPPPPPGHGDEDNQPVPIGSGIVVLLLLAGAYGVKKVYDANGFKTTKEPST